MLIARCGHMEKYKKSLFEESWKHSQSQDHDSASLWLSRIESRRKRQLSNSKYGASSLRASPFGLLRLNQRLAAQILWIGFGIPSMSNPVTPRPDQARTTDIHSSLHFVADTVGGCKVESLSGVRNGQR